MIVANLATYPPRADHLGPVVDALLPQVDRLNVVLNEYDEVPEILRGRDKVVPILPPYDLKDVGKFYPEAGPDDLVFLVDDDIDYPPDYIALTTERFEALGPGHMAGYHGSLYRRPGPLKVKSWLRFLFQPTTIARFRYVYWCIKALDAPVVVDQIATNACVIRGSDMPSFAYMETSQKFVDVRLAKWCHERGIRPVCLPREENWLVEIDYEDSIYQGFTKRDPAHVAREIRSYAFRVKGRGEAPKASPARMAAE